MNLPLLLPLLVTAALSIAGWYAVHRLSMNRDQENKRRELRTAAYIDFIRGVAALANLAHQNNQSKEHFLKRWEFLLLVADAKARIAIYGSKAVVSSLAGFLRGGAVLDSPERMKAFTAVCQTMRTDSRPGHDSATDQDVHFLLFDSD